MSVSFFRGPRTAYPMSELAAVRARLKQEKAAFRIFFRGPRKIRPDGQPASTTLKEDAVSFVVYRY